MDKVVQLVELVELVGQFEQQKGKHIKITLSALERLGRLDPEVRKIVLDGFNNYTRALLRMMNYSVEE